VKRLTLPLFAALSLALPAVAGVADDKPADPRTLVDMPAPMRQHMLGNMRDHLLALAQIQQALGRGAYDQAADIAEQRIGMSSLAAHGAAHMAPLMPQPMQDIGTQMHRAASRFAGWPRRAPWTATRVGRWRALPRSRSSAWPAMRAIASTDTGL